MADTAARLDLLIWRNDDVWEFPLRIVGPNLTGVEMRAQFRRRGDQSGPALAALATVTNGNSEGVRLAAATFVEGRWVNDVRIRLNKSTRRAFPYLGPIGETTGLAWALQIAGRTRLQGAAQVPPHVIDSDAAPLNRPVSYVAGVEAISPTPGATLTISQDGGATLVIDGADLVERAAGFAAGSADRKPMR